MLGALIAIFAGWNTKRLWPWGVLFLVVWPAIAVTVQLPSRREALQRLGETIELTSWLYLEAYLTTALVSALLFFAAFGLKRLKDRRATNKNLAVKQSGEDGKATNLEISE